MTSQPGRVIDLYAGPGGWDEGMRQLGITDVTGLEYERNACATARAAGHRRAQVDIGRTRPLDWGPAWGLVASPPCQAWSMAGKRAGELDRARTHDLIDRYAAGDDEIGGGWADLRSHHAAQPVRWVRDLLPTWVCHEQVPGVLGLWEHVARVYRGWGYSVWTGVLNAADYGVPQTRNRAILIARRDGRSAQWPRQTHARAPKGPTLFGDEELPWVSMADALGWGMSGRPSMTVTGGGVSTGGAEPFGNAARQCMAREEQSGRWAYRAGSAPNSAVRTPDEPAPTIAFGNNAARHGWLLHTNRGQEPDGSRQTVDPSAGPVPTLTGKSGGQWQLKSRRDSPAWVAEHGARENRTVDEPAPTLTGEAHRWTWGRPATTVQGVPRVSAPGHRDRAGGERQREKSVRITVQEAAILQSFPADYPWRGTKTAQYLQVGNAMPPLLAAHVARAATTTA